MAEIVRISRLSALIVDFKKTAARKISIGGGCNDATYHLQLEKIAIGSKSVQTSKFLSSRFLSSTSSVGS